MAFDRRNLAGRSGFAPDFNNENDAQVSKIEFLAHTDNNPCHVSMEDRRYWNSIEKLLKQYVDYRFKTIVGMFDFGEINIDNKLTLSEIILLGLKTAYSRIESERADRLKSVAEEAAIRERMCTDETNSRVSENQIFQQQLADLKADLEKEVVDRKEYVDKERRDRNESEDLINNNINQLRTQLAGQIYVVQNDLMTEVNTRSNADQTLRDLITEKVGSFDSSISSVQNQINQLNIDRSNEMTVIRSDIKGVSDRLNMIISANSLRENPME
jgi:hypothetical protein